jgi:hypothetical protein
MGGVWRDTLHLRCRWRLAKLELANDRVAI